MVDAGLEVAPPKRPPVGPEAGVAALAPPKRPPVGAEAGAAEEDGVAALAPAAPKSEEVAAGVEVAALLVAVVVAPAAGVEAVGVPASDSFLKRPDEAPVPAAGALGVDDPAAPNRLDVGAAEAALSLSPPRLNPLNVGVAAGCEEAGCDGVDPPRLKVGGLLAGVELGRAPPPNSPPAGLGVSWEAAGVAAPNSPEVGGVALLFASFEPAAPPKRPEVGVEVPAGLAPNKLDVVPDAGAAAGLEAAFPNRPELGAPLA